MDDTRLTKRQHPAIDNESEKLILCMTLLNFLL